MKNNSSISLIFNSDLWLKEGNKKFWRLLVKKSITACFSFTKWKYGGDVCVVFTDDEEMRLLNSKYRNKDSPTNVLSFPQLSFSSPSTPSSINQKKSDTMLGDVVLSYETVLLETNISSITFLNHTVHLIVHGILHLIGFDHEESTDAVFMQTAEVSVLNFLGVPSPYE